MKPGLRLACVLAATLAATPAAAQRAAVQISANLFAQCDGYGAPSKSGDGMTGMAYTLRIFVPQGPNGNTTRTAQAANAAGLTGLAACEAALASQDLEDGFWLRRVSLLRAKALHHLSAGDASAAMADLDQAIAAAKDPHNLYYERSLGLGIDFVRAYVLKSQGKTAEAEALALATLHKRPYCREAVMSAMAVVGEQGEARALSEIAHDIARIEPRLIEVLAEVDFNGGRFEEVVDLYPQLVFTPEPHRGEQYAFQLQQLALRNRLREEIFWAQQAGQTAYALAALGRANEAEDAIFVARKRLEKATSPAAEFLPASVAYKKNDVQLANQISDLKIRLQTSGGDILNRWEAISQVRSQVAKGDVIKAVQTLAKAPKGGVPTELIQVIVNKLGSDALSEEFKIELARREKLQAQSDRKQEIATLFEALPEAEAPDKIPPYQELPQAKFWSWNPVVFGYKTTSSDANAAAVHAHAGTIAKSVVAEMALLQAADQALKAGKDGFIITSRADTAHSVSNTMYGVVLNTIPTGYSADLGVLFVDKAKLPTGYARADWRVIDAAAVRANLGPAYPPPPPPTKERK